MSGLRFALFLQDGQNDYQSLMQTDCEQTARRLDVSLNVVSADKNAETQIRQIRTALSEPSQSRPRAFIVSPVSEIALMPLIHETAKIGIGWVLLSRWNDAIYDFRRQYSKVPIFAVLPDQCEVGRIQGQQLRVIAKPGSEVVLIQGPIATFSTRRRRAGLDQEIAERHDLRWSYLNGDWSIEGGQAAMESWLSTFSGNELPRFVIVGQNDSMAVGARRAVASWAIAKKGRTVSSELHALGCDGSPRFGARLVTTGELTATVVIPSVAGRALEEVVQALRLGRQPTAETMVAVSPLPDIASLSNVKRSSARILLR
jgi:ABC-type sugar transport system substrate-binding protein